MQQPPLVAIYLGNELLDRMRGAEKFREIGELAAEWIVSLPIPVEMFFGPITRGGIIRKDPKTGMSGPSYRENIRALQHSIEARQREGYIVLNQLVFQPLIDKHRKLWLAKHNRVPTTWHEPLKHEFYAPILGTGRVSVGHFILDWKRGNGARFAHEILTSQKKTILEHPQGYRQQLAA